ncbi:S-adenosylmethionine:tRNA ribosyltransferase-isomerase [bacterium]|nr:S-adenosylmethionine:tRNA ribosyltransferase-isomerase [bacterium]
MQDFAIHQEQINIDSNIFATIASYHQQQKTIVAVGTTVTRTLESLVYIRVYI